MITDPAFEVSAPNTNVMVEDTYQKWLNNCVTVCCIMRDAMCDKFSCKFINAQSKEMLQMLNKSFGTLENLSSTEHRSSKRGMKSMVHRYRARASKPNRAN